MERIRDPAVITGYLTDASNVRGWAEVLVRPRTTEEVAEVVRQCQDHTIPLLVSAARTSITAGASPEGGWILSTEALTRVGPIGAEDASAEAGVILGAFRREVEAHGRLYPPDPTSMDSCTLGGSIACNASGANTFRYGATRRWVEALEIVLATGEVLEVEKGDPIPADWPVPRWSPPAVKSAVGYASRGSLLDLLVGSEGTLGVITRARVRTAPLPEAVLGLLAWFPDRVTAVACMKRLRAAARSEPHGALSPRSIEYLDRACLAYAGDRTGEVPPGADAALLCEQEVERAHGAAGHLDAWFAALHDAGARADDTIVAEDEPSRARLLAMRHAIPAGVNETVVRNGMPKVGTDLAVPDEALDEMMTLYESAPLPSVLFGHLGDNHLHLNLLPRTPAELEAARAFHATLARRAVALGGTISAEHGVGKLKRDHLAWMVGEDVVDQFRRLKRHVDPNGILGRNNLVAWQERPSTAESL